MNLLHVSAMTTSGITFTSLFFIPCEYIHHSIESNGALSYGARSSWDLLNAAALRLEIYLFWRTSAASSIRQIIWINGDLMLVISGIIFKLSLTLFDFGSKELELLRLDEY